MCRGGSRLGPGTTHHTQTILYLYIFCTQGLTLSLEPAQSTSVHPTLAGEGGWITPQCSAVPAEEAQTQVGSSAVPHAWGNLCAPEHNRD